MQQELQDFYDVVLRLIQAKVVCERHGCWLAVDGCDEDMHFKVVEVTVSSSGCGQCGTRYPSARIDGTLVHNGHQTPFYANMKTWHAFSCKCSQCEQRTTPPEFLFEFYPDKDERHWLNVWISDTNLKFIKQ